MYICMQHINPLSATQPTAPARTSRRNRRPMGQAVHKLTPGGNGDQKEKKQISELNNLISDYIDEHYDKYKDSNKGLDDFYHAVYEIVEKLSEKSGAMQFKLPSIVKLREAFKEVHTDTSKNLTKNEFRKIVEKVLTLDSFYIGQGARDIFLYIFGIPVLALLAKRIIPGPTAAISDQVFIPVVTSGTVIFLAKKNKL